MPEALQNILNQALEFWNKITNTQKIIVGAVLGVAVLWYIAMGTFSADPAKEPLYENLSAADYGAITQSLDTMGYSWSGSGTTSIYVEPEDRQAIITRLAQENQIPAGVEGWEIFNMSRWDETTFDKDVKLHRAMKGSLEKMLMTLAYVKRADVQLAVPRQNNFLTNSDPVKASVLLTLKPGYESVNRKQVMGMKNLIFRAIPNLKRENITITDNEGKEFVEPDELDMEQRRLDLVHEKKRFEESERRKWRGEITDALREFYEADRITVSRMALTVNWDEVKEKQHLVQPVEKTAEDPNTPYPDRELMPNGTLVVSENARNERFRGNGFTPGGPTGTEQQLPPGYRDLDYQRSEYGNVDTIRNYDYNRVEKDVVRQPWEERARSLAVMLDGVWTREGVREDGKGWIRKYTPPSEEELKTLEKVVKNGVLYNAARGDQVTIAHLQKDRSAQFAAEDAELERKLLIQRLLIVSGIALVAFFLLFLLYRAIKKEIARRRRLREEELAAQQQLMREAALRVADEGAAEVELSIDEKARREMLENAINLAKEKPEVVAKLLRTWMAQED